MESGGEFDGVGQNDPQGGLGDLWVQGFAFQSLELGA